MVGEGGGGHSLAQPPIVPLGPPPPPDGGWFRLQEGGGGGGGGGGVGEEGRTEPAQKKARNQRAISIDANSGNGTESSGKKPKTINDFRKFFSLPSTTAATAMLLALP